MKHIAYVGYIMFVWMIDASIWDRKLYFIDSREVLNYVVVRS